MKEALLVIDMQEGCFKTPRYNKEFICSKINILTEYFRNSGKTVIFIQHDGTKENYLYPNSEDFKIIKDLEVLKSDFKIQKTANDSFYMTKLNEILKKLNIDTIFISGLATDFCVNATVHSALVKDYNLVIVSDCHTTGDKPQIKAKDIIEYHNLLWSNLTPTNGSVILKKYNDIVTV